MLLGDIREGIPNDVMGSSVTSSLGSLLISRAHLALVLTYKSIHVHKSTKNDDFLHSGTLDTIMDDQC